MTRRGARGLAVAMTIAWASLACGGPDPRAEAARLRTEIAHLERDRDGLRARLDAGVSRDPRLAGMPGEPLRVGVPTTLLTRLTASLTTGLANRVTVELGGLRVRRSGQVRRLVTLGTYDLRVNLSRITARLAADAPTLTFGANRIGLSVPVRLLSASGEATIDFTWDGRNIGGAVCGDMRVRERVTGVVTPATYTLSGSLRLSGQSHSIVATPRLPAQRIRIRVTPTPDSWATVQRLLDSKGGLCGFVLGRVDIKGALEGLLAKGFVVRLPTERLRPASLPVSVTQTLDLDGTPIQLHVAAATPTVTPTMVWLGAAVTIR